MQVGLLATVSLAGLARANPLSDAATLRMALVANGLAIAAVGLATSFAAFCLGVLPVVCAFLLFPAAVALASKGAPPDRQGEARLHTKVREGM